MYSVPTSSNKVYASSAFSPVPVVWQQRGLCQQCPLNSYSGMAATFTLFRCSLDLHAMALVLPTGIQHSGLSAAKFRVLPIAQSSASAHSNPLSLVPAHRTPISGTGHRLVSGVCTPRKAHVLAGVSAGQNRMLLGLQQRKYSFSSYLTLSPCVYCSSMVNRIPQHGNRSGLQLPQSNAASIQVYGWEEDSVARFSMSVQ